MGYFLLPDLRLDVERDLNRHLRAMARRDFTLSAPRPDEPGGLDVLCDWAWSAAIGPVLEHCLPPGRLPSGRLPSGGPEGRVPRIVLVPMGMLALVPWHAARRPDGTFAVELAAFSQTPSARLLCRSAQAPPAALGPVGLVVGDPDTGDPDDSLDGARLEAFAIHRAFYRDGRYLGRRADGSRSRSGPGEAGELRAWLAADDEVAGSVVHLACHGVVDTGSENPDSYLVLAGGSKARAPEIVEWIARTPGRTIGLAVLAACHTASSAQGYDEAYSLGTAFLAAGARSVISAQWAVPDQATSALMFMVHHHVAHDRLPAGEALRRAQLWMLDPAREIPATMPGALARRIKASELSQIDAWAGFVHLGR
jgi:CHAT domain-containing protein